MRLRWPVVRWRGGVEGADRFQRVAEEVEPQRLRPRPARRGRGCRRARRTRRRRARSARARSRSSPAARSARSCRSGCRAWRGTSAPRRLRPAACAAAAHWRWSGRRRGAASCAARPSPPARPAAARRRRRRARRGHRAGSPRPAVQHRQVGRGEGQRLGDRRQALAVARDEDDRAVGARSPPRAAASAKAS